MPFMPRADAAVIITLLLLPLDTLPLFRLICRHLR